MRISRRVRQYWPVTVVTVAIVLGLPFLTSYGDRRPGLAGLTGRAGGLAMDLDDATNSNLPERPQSGYLRPAGVLPFYGFDGVSLQTPIFKSWWDGKSAASKLKELNANTVILTQIWHDSRTFHDTMARLHGAGVKVIVQVTDASDWVDLFESESGQSRPVPHTFVTGRAIQVFGQARNQGVGRFADFVLVGGELPAISFASQLQRQKMYQLAKQYFPNTPILLRYGFELEKAEALPGKSHPMGGTWDEYRFGQNECDVALVSVGRGVEEGRVGVRVGAVLEQLNQIVSIVKTRQHDVAVVVGAQLGDDKLLRTTRSAMWSTKEIDQFVSAILTGSSIDGLLLKGMGSYTFDLGHPDFAAQRTAFRQSAPMPSSAVDSTERSPASSR